jgi:UDP-N-acetyl-D-galactosamine dehydrogenase
MWACLAVAFSEKFPVVGFDICLQRINELLAAARWQLRTRRKRSKQLHAIHFSTEPSVLSDCNFYIVTVPTPIDDYKQPNFAPLIAASKNNCTIS